MELYQVQLRTNEIESHFLHDRETKAETAELIELYPVAEKHHVIQCSCIQA